MQGSGFRVHGSGALSRALVVVIIKPTKLIESHVRCPFQWFLPFALSLFVISVLSQKSIHSLCEL